MRVLRSSTLAPKSIEKIARILPSATTDVTAQAQKSAALRLPAIVGSLWAANGRPIETMLTRRMPSTATPRSASMATTRSRVSVKRALRRSPAVSRSTSTAEAGTEGVLVRGSSDAGGASYHSGGIRRFRLQESGSAVT